MVTAFCYAIPRHALAQNRQLILHSHIREQSKSETVPGRPLEHLTWNDPIENARKRFWKVFTLTQ